MTLARFILYFAGLSSAIVAVAVVLPHLFEGVLILSPHFWLLFAVVSITTLLAYVVSDLGIKKGGEGSILSLMVGLFVKLLACLAVVAAVIIKYPDNKVITALNFFSLYFLFTAFEVTCLLRNLRDQNQM